VNEASPAALAREDFAAHYEQLRGDALARTGSRGIGLALFLRDGMAAWVQACSCGRSTPANHAMPPIAPIASPAKIRTEAAVILAGMILNCRPQKSLLASPSRSGAWPVCTSA